MADVLLGQSYFLRFDSKLWEAMQPYPPLGTLFAAAWLRRRGHDVALFDAMLADSELEWDDALARERPRYAVLFEDNFNYLSKMCLLRMREAAFRMIGMARERGSKVLVCGSDATDRTEEYLEAGAHFVLLGEGDGTLVDLLDALGEGGEAAAEGVAGLAFVRNGDGSKTVVRTARRPVLDDLDSLPRPAWDLVEIERYRRIWLERHGYFSLNMVATRGCPYHCNWCAKPIWGQTYHMRSPGHVADELRYLVDRYHPDHIWFADDILGLKRGWMAAFADELESRDIRVPFKCLSRADLVLRDGEVQALARAGCRIVWVGAESGSQKILDAMDKGTTVEQIREAARRLHAAGVGVGFFLQFGYPGEEWEDIERTLELVRDCRPDEIGMSVSYPLPGTRFFEMVRSELGRKQNWVDSADLDMMFRGRFTTAFYRQLCHVVQKEFRAHRAARDVFRSRRLDGPFLRKAAAAVVHSATLPFDRARLAWLRRAPLHRSGLGMLDSGMTPERAARPTPQSHER